MEALVLAFTRRRPRRENAMSTVDPHAGHTHSDPEMHQSNAEPLNRAGPTAIDPVCGMTVTLKPDTRTETFDGQT
jgi:Cu+-exporting ATPase